MNMAQTAPFISQNMHGCFMNTKYLFTSMKTYGTNLSLKQGYMLYTDIALLVHLSLASCNVNKSTQRTQTSAMACNIS